ncbi:MAG: hypothetical protein ACT6S0_19520 [Roseateles sp.]|uniref:hypothetical protein n=1 Tax=Roseateles sp. TaxID=1971397 RepID=UPI004036EC30
MPRLPPDWAAHLQNGVSHRLGGSHADGQPEICRGLAAQALPDGRVEVLLLAKTGEQLLAAAAASGRISYVAAQPGSFRTLHVKGLDAEIFAATPEHAAMFERCRERFIAQVEPLGFTRDFIMSIWYDLDVLSLAGIRFTPCGAWDQTPGPGAGQAIDLLT